MNVVVEPFGDAGLRARLPDHASGASLLEALRALPHVVDAVVAERHALVTFGRVLDPRAQAAAREALRAAIASALDAPTPQSPARSHEVQVDYGGDDLQSVARDTGLTREQVIALHARGEYVVAAIGFLPGFAYLRGLNPRLTLPRRASPRARIAALSVAIAGGYTGVYPCASPGGWHLIGTAVGFAPFRADEGAVWKLGDRVRFLEAGR
ncbi:MAG TPA: carboxyltransferase domain-containing protein [Polyangiaceae bacterium]|nr:carboxyltransferase domain-containing protein [Polyangiaceae bacterium]